MATLTPRQEEVLRGWLAGRTYRQLADDLGISPGTVYPHLKNIARKLGTNKTDRATLRASMLSRSELV